MKNPDIVPDKVTNPVNPLIIIGILGIGVVFFITLNLVTEDAAGMVALIGSVSFVSGVAILSFIVAKQNEVGILAKAYFALGLGFLSYVIGEILYYSIEDLFGLEAYPSIADVFFFCYVSLVSNTPHTKHKIFRFRIYKISKTVDTLYSNFCINGICDIVHRSSRCRVKF